MSGSTHPWIFRSSLTRVGQLALALTAFALGIAGLSHRSIPSAMATAVSTPASVDAERVTDATAEWPRTVLRLWFLVPQFLPRHDH